MLKNYAVYLKKSTDRYIQRPELVAMLTNTKNALLQQMLEEDHEIVVPVKGDNGTDGTAGVDGTNGLDGKDGTNGKDGKDGKDGTNGRDGLDGTNGTNGLPGTAGKDGTNGKDGLPGTNGKDGKDGLPGTNGKDGTNGLPGTPKRIEEYTATTNSAGVSTYTWTAFTTINSIIIHSNVVAPMLITGVELTRTLTGCTVQGLESRGTLLLSAGPFQPAVAGRSIKVTVIGS